MPNYIYVWGSTFYFLADVPADGDYVGASYSASHQDGFGHVNGVPCAKGGSYAPTDKPGLFYKV